MVSHDYKYMEFEVPYLSEAHCKAHLYFIQDMSSELGYDDFMIEVSCIRADLFLLLSTTFLLALMFEFNLLLL